MNLEYVHKYFNLIEIKESEKEVVIYYSSIYYQQFKRPLSEVINKKKSNWDLILFFDKFFDFHKRNFLIKTYSKMYKLN